VNDLPRCSLGHLRSGQQRAMRREQRPPSANADPANLDPRGATGGRRNRSWHPARGGYSAGAVAIEASDLLISFSDGINRAANADDQEFREDSIRNILSADAGATRSKLCDRIMHEVATFANAAPPPDDHRLRLPSLVHQQATLVRPGVLALEPNCAKAADRVVRRSLEGKVKPSR